MDYRLLPAMAGESSGLWRADSDFATINLPSISYQRGVEDIGEGTAVEAAEQDARYRDVDWVKSELNWHESLAVETRKLIAGL
jgi:hypothetical protein